MKTITILDTAQNRDHLRAIGRTFETYGRRQGLLQINLTSYEQAMSSGMPKDKYARNWKKANGLTK